MPGACYCSATLTTCGVSSTLWLLYHCLSDLVPKEIAEKWLAYLRKELPTVAFKSSTQTQKNNLVSWTEQKRNVFN